MTEAYNEGVIARASGKDLVDNPYAESTEQFGDWNEGWCDQLHLRRDQPTNH